MGKKRTSALTGTYVCALFQVVCLLFGILAYHTELCSKLELHPNSQTMETEVFQKTQLDPVAIRALRLSGMQNSGTGL